MLLNMIEISLEHNLVLQCFFLDKILHCLALSVGQSVKQSLSYFKIRSRSMTSGFVI